jgi:glycosyltransferase involved in cell wall biosynthesis
MRPSLSVVIPAFNEGENIARAVGRARDELEAARCGPLEWILVDDGSLDGTAAAIERIATEIPGTVVARHERRRGLGAALWTGVERATGEWCTWLPADGQVPASAVAAMAEKRAEADLVMLMRDERARELDRRLMTAGMYTVIRLLLGFDPYGFSGVFLARRDALESLSLRSATGVQNYAVVRHFLRKGYRIAAVRATMLPRLSGQSKVANVATTARVLWDILRLRAGAE